MGSISAIAKPVARKEENIKQFHGISRIDSYEWMRNKDSEELQNYVAAQNAYCESRLQPLESLKKTVFNEIKHHVLETDMSVPSRAYGYWYYSRIIEGQQYGIQCRKPIENEEDWTPPTIHDEPLDGEEVVFDANKESEGYDFFSLGGLSTSKDGKYLLYGIDTHGDERYNYRLRNLKTGQELEDRLDGIESAFLTPDAQWIFYTKIDAAWRPYAVMRHRVGTDVNEDVEIFSESDEHFWVGATLSTDERRIIVSASSKTTSEVWFTEDNQFESDLKLCIPRKEDVLYEINFASFEPISSSVSNNADSEKLEDSGSDRLPILILQHNAINPNFSIEIIDLRNFNGVVDFGKGVTIATGSPYGCEKGDFVEQGASLAPIAQPWYDERNPQILQGMSGLQISDLAIYRHFVVLSYSARGVRHIAVMTQEQARKDFVLQRPWHFEDLNKQVFSDDIYAHDNVLEIGHAGASEYDCPWLRYSFSSFIYPTQLHEYNVNEKTDRKLKELAVLGKFSSENYHEERRWVESRDNQQIPVSLVWDKRIYGNDEPKNAPMLLYGYGSYSFSEYAYFSVVNLSLLDRGVVYAVAHIRGGGEMGIAWYEQGRRLLKKHTFEDFIDVAEHLQHIGLADVNKTVASGGSAGGLLMGAIANMAPQTFKAIITRVPFVDALTSILDPSLPLTVIEWDEWGDPLHNSDVYRYMQSYSPYDNVPDIIDQSKYPNIFALSSMNDTRVLYVEPLKWVTKLQEAGSDAMVRLENEAGHAGISGRYRQWEVQSLCSAWILSQMGIEQ